MHEKFESCLADKKLLFPTRKLPKWLVETKFKRVSRRAFLSLCANILSLSFTISLCRPKLEKKKPSAERNVETEEGRHAIERGGDQVGITTLSQITMLNHACAYKFLLYEIEIFCNS